MTVRSSMKLSKNCKLRHFVCVISCASILNCCNGRAVEKPRSVDLSVGQLTLLEPLPASLSLGKDMQVPGQPSRLPGSEVSFCNKDCSQVLTMIHHPGSVRNNFSEFRIRRGNEGEAHKKMEDVEVFVTGRGIRLSLTQEKVVSLLGKPLNVLKSGNEEVMEYKIDDFKSSKFLQKYNMPLYYGKYRFVNNLLVEFSFGFGYP